MTEIEQLLVEAAYKRDRDEIIRLKRYRGLLPKQFSPMAVGILSRFFEDMETFHEVHFEVRKVDCGEYGWQKVVVVRFKGEERVLEVLL